MDEDADGHKGRILQWGLFGVRGCGMNKVNCYGREIFEYKWCA